MCFSTAAYDLKKVLTREENINIEMAFMLEYNVFISLFEKSVISNSNPQSFKVSFVPGLFGVN